MDLIDALIHVANVLYLVSYLVRDILWLRLMTVVAMCTLLPYYVQHDLWAALGWNLLFLVINLREIARLFAERRPVRLSAREERLYHLVFRALKPREFVKLLAIGRWVDTESDEPLLEKGQELDELRLIVEGEAAVTVGGEDVATLADGHFVGEMSYLTGEPTSAAVCTRGATTYVAWPKAKLDELLEKNPPIRAALQLVMGTDLAAKLRARSA